jgi:hypothetical protein
MSHFYSSIQGGKGKATRCGHKTTGIKAMARCHEVTLNVTGTHRHESNEDVFDIHLSIDSSHANSFHPLRIIFNGDTRTLSVDHVVGPGECHNVSSQQAQFLSDLDM